MSTATRGVGTAFSAGILLAILAFALGGCLFEPREAETPISEGIVEYNPRTSARNVWANLELALGNTDAGGWDENLSEDFQYFPDTETESLYPGIDWANWGKPQEMTFINNWFGSNVTITADLFNEEINTNDPAGTSGEWELIYFVRVIDEFNSETRYRGRAFIGFQLEGNFWYIRYWRDQQGETDPENPNANLQTLGVVRGAFASQ
jgi:hypothetical protein